MIKPDICILSLFSFIASFSLAAPPDLRDQVSLNGTWSFTPNNGSKTSIPVPEYWDANPGFTSDRALYERAVSVPSTWAGKVIKLEFEGINHIANVYVNDVLVASHTGGWIPFSADITNLVQASSSFLLKVDVKGGRYTPIVDGNGYPLWPTGWYTHDRGAWGIIHDVWLRAYGAVHIQDAFIQTSTRKNKLAVDYTLINSGPGSRTVQVRADALRQGSQIVEKSFLGPVVTLAFGEIKTVRLEGEWPNPSLWTPESPHLYVLKSSLLEGINIWDTETRRFGFREVWISGSKLLLNGVRLNLRGESIIYHSQGWKNLRYDYIVPSKWGATIDRFQDLNINMVRFHMSPAPSYVLETADERGLLVIEESAIDFRRDFHQDQDKAVYIENCKKWILPWVRGRRNHASIIMWSVENEMVRKDWFTGAQVRPLGDLIRELDPTRPVFYSGAGEKAMEEIVNVHYLWGNKEPTTNISYTLGDQVAQYGKPVGAGEFFYSPVNKQWWHGIWPRGLRYSNYMDIRPYTIHWAHGNPTETPEKSYLRNSYAPVALFDRAYDELGVDPLDQGLFPSLDEGVSVQRTLILFNDEFSGKTVTVEVSLQSGVTVYSVGSETVSLELGEHAEIKCAFQVPFIGGKELDLVLVTRKMGKETFREAKRFKVRDVGKSGASNQTVELAVITGATHVRGMPGFSLPTTLDNLNSGQPFRLIDVAGRTVWSSRLPTLKGGRGSQEDLKATLKNQSRKGIYFIYTD